MYLPCDFIPNREDVPFRVEVFSHAHFSKLVHCHDSDSEWKRRTTLCITWNSRNAMALRCHGMGFQTLRLGMTLNFGGTG